jgi:hypothetical protein
MPLKDNTLTEHQIKPYIHSLAAATAIVLIVGGLFSIATSRNGPKVLHLPKTIPARVKTLRDKLLVVQNPTNFQNGGPYNSIVKVQWPNWPNWGNWNNWRNWPNWSNWVNWANY